MNYWRRIESSFHGDGVLSITHKIAIVHDANEQDFYVKIGWWHGRPVFVDVTMARHASDGAIPAEMKIPLEEIPLVIELRRQLLDNTRSSLETICREASLLLSSKRCAIGDVADLWRGTEMYPAGECPAVEDDLGSSVKGPLDAVAKLFQMRGSQWEKEMAHEYTEAEIEKLIEDCEAAVDERSDEFTAWEIQFIESVSDQNELGFLSPQQIEKLEQIWEQRECG